MTEKVQDRVFVGIDPATHTGLAAVRVLRQKGTSQILNWGTREVYAPKQEDVPSIVRAMMLSRDARKELVSLIFSLFNDEETKSGYASEVVGKYKPVPCIEGYAYANQHTLVTLVEVGTMLRYMLHKEAMKSFFAPYTVIPPTVLKKFVTGKGNARKDSMRLELFKRWRLEAPTDNEVDALALALFGAVMTDTLDAPKSLISVTKKYV